MDDTPPHRMVSPRPETENSGHRETDSRCGDLPLESPPNPHSCESSQSRNVSTEKSGDIPRKFRDKERRLNARFYHDMGHGNYAEWWRCATRWNRRRSKQRVLYNRGIASKPLQGRTPTGDRRRS
ncbi:hypothetical protein HPB50_028780 [Hyalomma asiaticum]|nr:hypothetical protein HPB50_028780 [Hyalomma asiaticum]